MVFIGQQRAGLFSHFVAVDDEEDVLFDDVPLYFHGQVGPILLGTVHAAEQEGAARLGVLEHVHAFEEVELVAGHETRLVGLDQVRRADRLGAEAQVRHGHGTDFFES